MNKEDNNQNGKVLLELQEDEDICIINDPQSYTYYETNHDQLIGVYYNSCLDYILSNGNLQGRCTSIETLNSDCYGSKKEHIPLLVKFNLIPTPVQTNNTTNEKIYLYNNADWKKFCKLTRDITCFNYEFNKNLNDFLIAIINIFNFATKHVTPLVKKKIQIIEHYRKKSYN